MIHIYVNKFYIPNDEWLNKIDTCFPANLPDNCPKCGNKNISVTIGNSNMAGSLRMPICGHYLMWPNLWSNKIKTTGIQVIGPITIYSNITSKVESKVKKISTEDGMKCSGSCGMWNPMVEANRDDGSFICYSCRSGF